MNHAMVHETTLGAAKLTLIGTRNGRFRIELAGERRRVRARKVLLDLDEPQPGSHEWLEDYDADLDILVGCLESKHTRRTESDGRLVLELREYGLSGYDATWTVTITVNASGVVEVDMKHRINELNPGVGW